jgi:hypothetical protein
MDGIGVDGVRLDDILVIAHGKQVDTLGDDVCGLVLEWVRLDIGAVAEARDRLDNGAASGLFDQRQEEELGSGDVILQLDDA